MDWLARSSLFGFSRRLWAEPLLRNFASASGGSADVVEQSLEAPGVRLLGLGERLEPIGDLHEALLACRLGEPRVHVGVLVGFPGDRRLEVLHRVADRKVRRGIADRLQIVEVAVSVARLAFCRLAEVARDFRVTFDVGDLCEVEVATVRLAFASERFLQVLLRLRALEFCHGNSFYARPLRARRGEYAAAQ